MVLMLAVPWSALTVATVRKPVDASPDARRNSRLPVASTQSVMWRMPRLVLTCSLTSHPEPMSIPACRRLGRQCHALDVTLRVAVLEGQEDHDATWMLGHTERIEFGRTYTDD